MAERKMSKVSQRNGALQSIRSTKTSSKKKPTMEPKRDGTLQSTRGAATKKTKKEKKTADELMLEAWKYTYETRHRRLSKP
jgi:hypothetical protein